MTAYTVIVKSDPVSDLPKFSQQQVAQSWDIAVKLVADLFTSLGGKSTNLAPVKISRGVVHPHRTQLRRRFIDDAWNILDGENPMAEVEFALRQTEELLTDSTVVASVRVRTDRHIVRCVTIHLYKA